LLRHHLSKTLETGHRHTWWQPRQCCCRRTPAAAAAAAGWLHLCVSCSSTGLGLCACPAAAFAALLLLACSSRCLAFADVCQDCCKACIIIGPARLLAPACFYAVQRRYSHIHTPLLKQLPAVPAYMNMQSSAKTYNMCQSPQHSQMAAYQLLLLRPMPRLALQNIAVVCLQ
jgi:hypothetical protein